MTLPFSLPDWVPWWLPTIVLVLAVLWFLAFLLVPFSVIGLKARLDGLEARLDEIHAEIRRLALRLPDSANALAFDELYAPEPRHESTRRPSAFTRPPIPPAAHELEEEPHMPEAPPPAGGLRFRRPEQGQGRPAARENRTEPRLDWPR